MKRILLLDDEQNVLNALQRELKSDYEIEAFTSPSDALEHCRDKQFDLVIADYQMPEMNGIQFLVRFRELQPDAARLLLSGQADIQGLLGAVNQTHVYRFIGKPWEKAELKACIAQALAYRDILLENRRLAAANKTGGATLEARDGGHGYRIMLVDGDEDALKLMRHGLTQPGAEEGLYDAMRMEFSPDRPAPLARPRLEAELFTTPAAALERAKRDTYDLVIAGQNPGDMDGIEFLVQFRKLQPDAGRILVSGHVDKQLISRAINEAQVYCFLNLSWNSYELKADARRKAWNIHQFKSAVMEALTARELVLENRRLAGEAQ